MFEWIKSHKIITTAVGGVVIVAAAAAAVYTGVIPGLAKTSGGSVPAIAE